MEFKRFILSSKERVNDTKSRQKLNSCLRVDKINFFFFLIWQKLVGRARRTTN